jgi:methylglutaconyl-CoA hydratase
MTEPVILTRVDDRGVAWVHFNRPKVNNAYNGELLHTALDGLQTMRDDPAVRVVVLRGNGRHFQAGADLTWSRSVTSGTPEDNIAASRVTAQVVRTLNELSKPTIALVHGACIGGGTGIVAACDVVIASDDAFFAISEARWGLAANPIFPQLNAAMGERHVRRYAQTCERFSAAQAQQMGLVHEVCAPGALDEAVQPVLNGLLMSGPEAMAESKRVIQACAGALIDDDTLEALILSHAAKRQSAEAAEGLLSFHENRDPTWYPGADQS